MTHMKTIAIVGLSAAAAAATNPKRSGIESFEASPRGPINSPKTAVCLWRDEHDQG